MPVRRMGDTKNWVSHENERESEREKRELASSAKYSARVVHDALAASLGLLARVSGGLDDLLDVALKQISD